jgi:hypothetical protein
MQDVHWKLNPGLPRQKQHSTEDSFHQQTGLKFKEETNKVLHFQHTETWDTLESKQKYLKFLNVVLEKD